MIELQVRLSKSIGRGYELIEVDGEKVVYDGFSKIKAAIMMFDMISCNPDKYLTQQLPCDLYEPSNNVELMCFPAGCVIR